jgi:hypothetical protein
MSKVWSQIQPTGDAYAFQPGERYAVLASVSRNFTLDQIKAKAESQGFSVTYDWEQGSPSRGLYPIDDWLAGLPADTTSNHRWVYAEGNFAGASAWSLSVDPPWPFTIYHVEYVFQAVEAAADQPAPPHLPSAQSTVAPPSSGTGLAVLGVAAALLLAIGIGYAANVTPAGWLE